MALTQINSNSITDGSITNADISSSAAIDESKLTITSVGGANGVDFNDSVKARFGTGNDLEIYHDSNNSAINHNGTGNFYIQTLGSEEDIYIRSADNIFIQPNANDNGIVVTGGGGVNLYHNNATKLNTTSTGINVTGTVTCDGLSCDGGATIRAGTGVLDLVDNNNTGNAVTNFIRGRNSANTDRWRVGQVSTGNEVLYLQNFANQDIIFNTNNANRGPIQNDGHLRPSLTDSYDLGTPNHQWRNAYFDGTVNCDGLTCEGDATVTSATGRLYVQDNNNTGTSADCAIIGRDSANNSKWYYGTGSGTDSVYLWNYSNDVIQFGTNNSHRISLTAAGHLVPNGGNQFDLGDNTNRWRNVYTNDLNLSNEGGTNDVDGTWGSWTIQEGEDDLFLLNRRNGKKYKFNLSEVN